MLAEIRQELTQEFEVIDTVANGQDAVAWPSWGSAMAILRQELPGQLEYPRD